MDQNILKKINDDSLKTALTIFTKITDEPGKYSLSELSSILGINEYTIMQILSNMLRGSDNIFTLYAGDYSVDADKIIDKNYISSNDMSKLRLISKYELTDKKGKLQFEKIRQKFMNSDKIQNNDVIIKHTYTSSQQPHNKLLNELRKDFGTSMTRQTELPYETIYPLTIYHDGVKEVDYLVDIIPRNNDYVVRFHSTDNMKLSGKRIPFSSIYHEKNYLYDMLISKLKRLWTPVNFWLSEEETIIKVLVLNEANCLRKINHDISNYEYASLKQLEQDKYLLTAKIIGIEGFINWIMSYGSSIVVLEPENIRQIIIKKYQNISKKYI